MADEIVTTGPEDGSKQQQGAPLGAGNAGAPDISGAPAPVPGAVPTPPTKPQLATDIAKILETVKLPERLDAKSSGDVRPPKRIEISPLLSDAPVISSATATETAGGSAPGGDPIVAMHTLRDDLKHVIRDEKISYVRAAALEQEKRSPEQEEAPVARGTGRMRGILFTVGILSLLGLAALGGVYFVVEQQAAPLPQQKSDSLVFAEQSTALPLDNTDQKTLKSELAQVRNASHASLGSITRIVPTFSGTSGTAGAARPATFSEFMNAIGAHPPADLLRALSDTFFLGIHTVDKNAPVFVIPVTSYDNAFAGMLDWEAQMNADLSPLFTPLTALTQGPDGIPTQRAFTDVVMRNYDVRALKDDSGTIELYYSFPTRNILIIAESPYTFAEILTRLQAARSL